MGDLLQDGSDWLADVFAEHGAQSITYSRGAASITIPATVGQVLLLVADRAGNVKVQRTDRDFIVRTADLDFGHGRVDPARGDRITLALKGRTKTYEVLPYGDEPCFRDEPGEASVRVHTKYLSG